MATARDIAAYLVHLADCEPEREAMTQMRLHKLLYYVQAWSLVDTGTPMFSEMLQAWQHGPVVPALRPEFREFEDEPIPAKLLPVPHNLTPQQKAVIQSVWETYKGYSTAGLRRKTHEEVPYQTARGDLPEDAPSSNEISLDSIQTFFQRVQLQDRLPGLEADKIARAEREFREGRGISFADLKTKLLSR